MESDKNNIFKWMKSIVYGGLAIAVVFAIAFCINQYYDCSRPFDTGIFGTYGDFIGGVLGTVVALYSAYLLVKTFMSQSNVNESVIETNKSVVSANIKAEAASERQYYQTELQLFDNKFHSFLNVYYKVIDGYSHDNKHGRTAFEEEVKNFVDIDFKNNYEFKRRCDSAISKYLKFYSEHRVQMSVHLRVLYLMISLIAKSGLKEDDKVLYAKLVRGQLSDAEMLIIRYNCCSELGQKMREYCNEFNLIKHLPLLNLLELKSYRIKIAQKVEEQQCNDMVNGLNTMFITIKKKAVLLLYDGNFLTDQYNTSHNYTIQLSRNEERTNFTIGLCRKNNSRRGGGAIISADENALDCFKAHETQSLFRDFVYDLFVTSNFGLYNDGVQLSSSIRIANDPLDYKFTISISNTKRLVLSYIQMQERDNPIDNIEN